MDFKYKFLMFLIMLVINATICLKCQLLRQLPRIHNCTFRYQKL